MIHILLDNIITFIMEIKNPEEKPILNVVNNNKNKVLHVLDPHSVLG